MENENQNIENTSIEQTQTNITGETNSELNLQGNAVNEPIQQEVPTEPVVNETMEPVIPEAQAEPVIPEVQTDSTTVEVPAEEVMQSSTEEVKSSSLETKKKSPLVPIIIVVAGLLLVGLILGAIFILPNFLFSGKKALENEITSVFNLVNDSLDESEKNLLEYDIDKDSLGITGSLTMESNYKDENFDLSKLKDYKIDYSGVIDKGSNTASLNARLIKNATNLLAIDGYVDGKTVYLSLGDIFNKVITTDTEDEIKDLELSKSGDIKDIKKILDKTKEAVIGSINEDNITVEKEDGLKKVTYKYKSNELEKVVINAYLNDSEIIEIFSEMSAQSEDKVKEALNDELKEIEKDTDNDETIVVLYLKGLKNDFVKTEIRSEKSKLLITKEADTYNYVFEEEDNNTKIKGDFNLVKDTFNMNIGDNMSVMIQGGDKKATINLDYNDGSQLIKVQAIVTNNVNKNKQTNNAVIDLEYTYGNETITATINNDITIEKNKEVEKTLASSDTIYYEDLTETEINAIESKLYEKLGQVIEDIMPGYNSMNDSDLDYDYSDYDLDY